MRSRRIVLRLEEDDSVFIRMVDEYTDQIVATCTLRPDGSVQFRQGMDITTSRETVIKAVESLVKILL